MLKDNLVRQGVDLSFETNLVYLDVNNLRVGINQSVPTVLLDVNGTAKFGNVQISTNTIASSNTNGNITLSPNGTGNILLNTATANRVVYAGANKELLTSANLTFDGTTVTIANGNLTTLNAGNIQTSGNTISSINTNGNINLSPNGTGNVIVNSAQAYRLFYAGVNKELITAANLTFTGLLLTVTGDTTISGTGNIGNLALATNTLSSTNTNGNINFSPNGTGNVIVSTASANRIFYSGTNKELTTNSNLTYNGTLLTVTGNANVSGTANVGNIQTSANTISSINTNGNINIDPAGTGQIFLVGTNAVNVPSGTTGQRPTGQAGDIRVNTSTSSLEFNDGISWIALQGLSPVASNSFNGDGVTSVFTLSQQSTTDSTLVSINGVLQKPGDSYSVTGTSLTFLETPISGDAIDVRMMSLASAATNLSDLNTSVTVNNTNERIDSTVNGNLILRVSNAAILPGSNVSYDIGSSSLKFKEIFGNVFTGTGSVASITNSAPASSGATGTKGQMSYSGSFLYICVATNTWVRIAITTSF